jgi:hypothetical protein
VTVLAWAVGFMPAFADTLDDQETAELLAHLRATWPE